MDVRDAVSKRFSARAFRPDPVPLAIVRDILERASRSPSGANLQPWFVYVLTGEPLRELKALMADKLAAGLTGETKEFAFHPSNLWEPYRSRRRNAGALRYAALGFGDKDPAGLQTLMRRNYEFFGAPVGLFLCLDRRMCQPQWGHLGMYMQTVMLLAVENGLDTCPQESWANWPETISKFLDLPDELMLFAGMALGYRDTSHPVNQVRTEREPIDGYARFLGF